MDCLKLTSTHLPRWRQSENQSIPSARKFLPKFLTHRIRRRHLRKHRTPPLNATTSNNIDAVAAAEKITIKKVPFVEAEILQASLRVLVECDAGFPTDYKWALIDRRLGQLRPCGCLGDVATFFRSFDIIKPWREDGALFDPFKPTVATAEGMDPKDACKYFLTKLIKTTLIPAIHNIPADGNDKVIDFSQACIKWFESVEPRAAEEATQRIFEACQCEALRVFRASLGAPAAKQST